MDTFSKSTYCLQKIPALADCENPNIGIAAKLYHEAKITKIFKKYPFANKKDTNTC